METNPVPQYPSEDNGYNRGLKKGSFEFSKIPESMTPEMILLDALETIVKVGKDWEWSEDFWAIRIAKEALSEYSKKCF